MAFSRYLQGIIGGLCLVGALALTALVCREGILPMDTATYGWFAAHLISPGLTPVVLAVTRLASGAVLIAIAAVLFIVLARRRRWRLGAAIVLNLGFAALLNQCIKNLIGRPRPYVTHLAVEHGFSFPSGHAMASTAFYGFLAWVVWRTVRRPAVKWPLMVLLALVPPAIMATRVYLGVHWVSDVLAGGLYSLAWLLLVAVPVTRATALPPEPVPRHARR